MKDSIASPNKASAKYIPLSVIVLDTEVFPKRPPITLFTTPPNIPAISLIMGIFKPTIAFDIPLLIFTFCLVMLVGVNPSPKANPPCLISRFVTPPILLAIWAKYLSIESNVSNWGWAKSSKISIDFVKLSLAFVESPKTEPVPSLAFSPET